MEWHWQLSFAKYGEAWRQGRRLLDRSLRPGAAATHRPVQEAGVRALLTRLLATPNQWQEHIELCEIVSFRSMVYPFINFFSVSKANLFWVLRMDMKSRVVTTESWTFLND
jgi:hypothetical protein